MSDQIESSPGINSWLEEELYQQYLHDRSIVDPTWKKVFESNGVSGNGHHNGNGSAAVATGSTAASVPAPAPAGSTPAPAPGFTTSEPAEPLRGVAAKIAENMQASLEVPTATSVRSIAVKVIEENRQLLNQYRTLQGKSKISYTHLIGWAIVKALGSNPGVNHACMVKDGAYYRVMRPQVNLGIAVDVAGKDGNRSLMVPSIKNANTLTFAGFLKAFDDIVARARTGKLGLPDFQGTTISLTNPGTVGTLTSVPRLVQGQGAIIATGAIDYPPEHQGSSPAMKAALGLSKVMMVTCTYDHRIIQGAESGAFLGKLQALLNGEDGFYQEIFRELEIPAPPVRWEADTHTSVSLSQNLESRKEVAVGQLIQAYRLRGHFLAALDPLGAQPKFHPTLDPSYYGLSVWDLDREFPVGSFLLVDKKGRQRSTATLREILDALRQTYCAHIGAEFMYIQDVETTEWLQRKMEPTQNNAPLDADTRRRILDRLLEAQEFEQFLHNRFIGKKRFSLEGGEATIPALDEILNAAAAQEVHEVVIGMAHRGRLNVLSNIVGKPASRIFAEFEESIEYHGRQSSGDVKYHLGASGVRRLPNNREIKVSLAFNPSHLEAVDPVVEGIVRPKQDRLGDTKRERVIPILIHGDAAFSGQGVVMETLNLSQLEGYSTGGTIHLIINNQVGFTANPKEARSSPYASDVARSIDAPVFHVNGDDPEAVIRVSRLAYEYRQQFKRDVVIDLICYRRLGHNEGDDATYTQPLMYAKIAKHPTPDKIYAAQVIKDKLVTADEVDQARKRIKDRLSEQYDASKKLVEQFESHEMTDVTMEEASRARPHTAIDRKLLERVVTGMTSYPESFHIHPKLIGLLKKRRDVLSGEKMDWATAEAIAFGSLALEGTPVRLSGQDSGRGTFSQRQLELHDVENGEKYVPLKHLAPDQARIDILNSSLSEYGVMGFEFGYSVADPLSLVLWEGQFGDFANGAQIMIDQFLSCAETKWGQPSGLVLLLPHGYEGQGPEHSSARIERFLQLCAEDNMQVANCTTPAQYFHLLRRQMHGGHDRRGMRKPLIIFTPKSLLRNAISTADDLTSGSFRSVLDDETITSPDSIKRVLFCSGKVYFDLLAAREQRKSNDVAIVRVEQLYPFPEVEVEDAIIRYPSTAEIYWVQEEPRNMGPWRFILSHLQPLLDESHGNVHYAGRPESASPAVGQAKRHAKEQAAIIEMAFGERPPGYRSNVHVKRARRR